MITKSILKYNIKRIIIMKKIFAIFGAALMMFACTKNEIEVQGPDSSSSELSFVASIDSPQTKVATSQGKNTWEAGDGISLFSVTSDGTIVGQNVAYEALTSGASTEFIDHGEVIAPSDKYYAYFPHCPAYPSKLNANTDIGFEAVALNDTVTNYRFMPIWVNTGVTITYDPATGKAESPEKPFFWASADAAAPGQPVNLVFKPILPMIEFGLKGEGTVATMVIEYADKSFDALDNATSKWLSGKGVFDISTGTLYTTNTSSSGYSKFTVTLNTADAAYVQLDPETPIYFQINVGRFEVTKGLKLTFTDKDGAVITKTIWVDKTYKGMTDEGKPKFISQVVNVTDKIIYDTDSYYEVDMAEVDWTKSYVHHVKDFRGNLLAVISKEFFGATQNKQGIVMYPVLNGTPDYTKGSVLQVTLDGDDAPAENVHGGSLNAWTTHADSVVYTAGTSALINKVYIKGDVSEFLYTAPAGEMKTPVIDPYTLTSTSGEVHPLVKIGDRFWTATCYKTTKTATDKGDIPTVTTAPDAYERALFVDDDTDTYLYNGVPLSVKKDGTSFTNKIAPSGWTLPSVSDWSTDLADFLGGAKSYDNMQKALLYKTNSYCVKVGQNISQLAYFSTWSCDAAGSSKLNMLLCKPDTAPGKSAQSYKVMFEVRLVSIK